MPKVSVIIVNHNGERLIARCMRSLERQTYRDFEIIVVDNASTDSSLIEIKNFMRHSSIGFSIILIPFKENTGFTGGNVIGLKHARGKYIALLNNDAEAEPGWLKELVMAMDTHSDVGICASKLVVYGATLIDSAGDGYATSLKAYKRGEGWNSRDFDRQEYVFGACGGAALYRRRMLDEIGFLDEDFFLIHEDTDLNLRAQLAGWKVLYIPSAIVHHKVRSSIGYMSETAVYFTVRNSELVRIKNIPIGVFLRCLPSFVAGFLTEILYFVVKHKRVNAYLRAKRDVLKLLPRMLEKRKAIMKLRKTDNEYLLSLLTPVWQRDFLFNKCKKLIEKNH